MARKKSILFITPGASRVGGNLLLLDFLRRLKRNSDVHFIVVYGHGGELENEFAALCPAFRFNEEFAFRGFFKGNYERFLHRLDLRRRRLQADLKKFDISLVYCNAVTNWEMLSAIAPPNVPVVSHCHELESVIRRTGLAAFEKTKKATDYFIAVSNAVKDNLVKNHSVAADKVEVIYGFVPVENFSANETARRRRKVFEELDFPPNAFVVGASGTLYWRKAPEIFVQIAAEVRRKSARAPVYFLWVGGAAADDFRFYELEHDVKKLGLQSRVRFTAHKSDPTDYFAALDVFAMTSREDPFPLVCLEAAALGKPIVCFDGAGGAPEFVADDCGFVAPYLNVEAFADKICALAEDANLTEALGRNAARKVREQHSVERAAPQILEVINGHGNFL